MTTSRLGTLLGFALLTLLVADAPAAAQERPRSGGELTFVVPAEPPGFDAHREETFGIQIGRAHV